MTKPDVNAPAAAEKGLSRRTVMRTGAHAAWAVPAISVATAAPALAASGPAALSVILAPIGVRVPLNTVNINATVTNNNTLATTDFQVVLDLYPDSPGDGFDWTPGATSSTPTGFSAPIKGSVPSQEFGVRFTYIATSQLAGSGAAPSNSRSFAATVTIANARAGTAVLTALPGGAGTAGSDQRTFI